MNEPDKPFDLGGMLPPGRTSVAISRTTHASLIRFAGLLATQEGRQYTMDQAIARAVEIATVDVMTVNRPKPVDNS